MQRSQAEARARETSTSLLIQISVQWLTPVVQKFRGVSVGSRYAKVGSEHALYRDGLKANTDKFAGYAHIGL